MARPITSKAVTDGQKKQVKRFAEDAIDRAVTELGLGKDGFQRIIIKGNEFQADIVASIRNLSARNQWKGIIVPELLACVKKQIGQSLPNGAEEWLAIPRWQTVAKTYAEAVLMVFGLIEKAFQGKFYNFHKGDINPRHLRQSVRTVKAFQALSKQQNYNDILVFPCQFGLRYSGLSVSQAQKVISASEFALDAFSVGIMWLTYPQRLMNTLYGINCAGDEFSINGDSCFGHAPGFYYHFDDGVVFDTHHVDDVRTHFGSASGFFPPA